MVGSRRELHLADVRKGISTSIRDVADDLTDVADPAAAQVRRDLYEIADRYAAGTDTRPAPIRGRHRYAAGTETQQDSDTLIRLHAFVMNLTAGWARTEERNDG